MGTQERICRLCLKICDNFKSIEGDMRDILVVVLPKINLATIQELVMCTPCTEMLIKCFDFKAMCIETYNYIVPYINKDNVKLDLKAIYLKKNENAATGVHEDLDVCGFCLSLVKNFLAIPLDVEEGDVILEKMIEQCLPGLDISIIKKHVICPPCYGSLGNCFRFMSNCLVVEENIKEYCESLDLNRKGQIELSSVIRFTMRNVKSEVDGNSVTIIKVEEQCSDDKENDKEKIDHKNKNYTYLDDSKFNNEEQYLSKSWLICKEENNKLDVIKIEESFCEENESELCERNLVSMEDQTFLVKEEIEIKTEEQDFNSFEDEILPQPEVTTMLHRRRKCSMPNLKADLSKPYTKHISANKNAMNITMFQCECCSFQTKYKHYLKIHSLVHKSPSEAAIYKCDSCLYQTNGKHYLKKHLLVHKDPSEIIMFRCDFCSYQTKHKRNLKIHLLIHKNPSEEIYNCTFCSYRTAHKSNFEKHLQMHETPSNVKMYKCESCSYQTKGKRYLKKHALVHKNSSEVIMYKCTFCSYQTKYKHNLKTHLLMHENPSEVIKYICAICSFQTRHKSCLKTHFQVLHNTPSDVAVYKCDSCSYQTQMEKYLKRHLLVHMRPSNRTMYKCDSCLYETKYEMCLKKHLRVHKDPSEVRIYKCDSCSYQSKGKRNFQRHLLLHKDPSEVTMYKCDVCSFQTKHKYNLKPHLLVHKNSSEIAIYKCDFCSYQTKRKDRLKIHLAVHRDLSEIAVYKCDSCSFQTKHKDSIEVHLLLHENPSEVKIYNCD